MAICFGIAGNIISYMIWTRGTRCRKLPGGIYLRSLAVSDTIALCIPALHTAVNSVFSVNLRHLHTVFCKVETTGRHIGLLVSSWIIVCFTIERTLSVLEPHMSSKWFNKHRTISIIVVIFILNFLLNVPYGIVYDVFQISEIHNEAISAKHNLENLSRKHNDTSITNSHSSVYFKQECTCDSSSVFAYSNWYHIWFMDFMLIFIVPFLLITISNTAVLFLIVTRRKRKTLQSTQGSRTFGVTMRAVTVSIVHCITTGPYSILVLIPGLSDTASRVKYSPEYYFDQLAVLLAHLNHAVNFVLYSFLGSDFKRDCAEMVCRRKRAIHPQTITGTTSQFTGHTTFDQHRINIDRRS